MDKAVPFGQHAPVATLCPRCDGQGSVTRMIVAEWPDPFWVCDECEAVWLGDEIAPTPDGALETLFAQWGHSTHWDGMEPAHE